MNENWLGGLTRTFRVSSSNLAWRAAAVCLICGLAVLVIETFKVPLLHDILSRGEAEVIDRFISLRQGLPGYGQRQRELAGSIVIVTMDPESGRRLGLPGNRPWPRSVIARLIEKLNRGGAAVIGLDVDLEGESSDPSEKRSEKSGGLSHDDAELSEVLKSSRNILLATNLDYLETQPGSKSRVFFHTPYEAFLESLGADAGSLGNAQITVDKDGIARRAQLIFDRFGTTTGFYKSFAMRIAEKKMGARAIVDNRSGHVFLKDRIYPDEFRINYLGPRGSFRTMPLWQALDWEKHVTSSKEVLGGNSPFKNKVVLVGFAESRFHLPHGASPRQSAPYEATYLTPVSDFDNKMPAVEVHANILSNLINRTFLTPVDDWKMLLCIALVAAGCGLVFGAFAGRPVGGLISLGAFALFWLCLSFFLFCQFNQVIPTLVPVFAVALPCWLLVLSDQNLYVFRERRRHTRLFRSFTAKHVAQQIDRAQLAELGLDGKHMHITVMVCRVRDFMKQVDNLPPDRIFQIFNECVRIMIDQIFEHRGLVDRITSYGVVAFWGAPLTMSREDQARLAAECAIAIRERIVAFSDGLPEMETGLTLTCTCGINTGDAFCGTIDAGARDTRFAQYSALGEAVDHAIMLEDLNTTYGTNFIIGEETAVLIGDALELRQIDCVNQGNAGKAQPIYQLLAAKGGLPAAMEEAIDVFKTARASFDRGEIKEAEHLFATILHMVPNDQPTTIMLKRCRETLSEERENGESSQSVPESRDKIVTRE